MRRIGGLEDSSSHEPDFTFDVLLWHSMTYLLLYIGAIGYACKPVSLEACKVKGLQPSVCLRLYTYRPVSL